MATKQPAVEERARRACRARFRKNHDSKLATGSSCADCDCDRIAAELRAYGDQRAEEARAEEQTEAEEILRGVLDLHFSGDDDADASWGKAIENALRDIRARRP